MTICFDGIKELFCRTQIIDMKNTLKPLSLILLVCVPAVLIYCFPACTKNTNPQPGDTVTIIKHDTTQITDTLYGTKPDSTVNLAKGLLLYLPFNGSIADSSGNGNPTTAVNGAGLTYDMHGYANSAFGGNGSNQAIVVTNNGSIKFDTAYSISLDFMTTDLSTRHTYLSMVDYSNAYGPTFEVGNSLPTEPGLFDVGCNDVALGCDNYGDNEPTNINDTTSLVPALGAWYNAIVIYHRASVQVYINGKLISQKTGTGSLAELCPSSQVIVGGWWVSDPIGVAGAVDNVRLYNRVLTPHEIATLAAYFQVNSNSVKR